MPVAPDKIEKRTALLERLQHRLYEIRCFLGMYLRQSAAETNSED